MLRCMCVLYSRALLLIYSGTLSLVHNPLHALHAYDKILLQYWSAIVIGVLSNCIQFAMPQGPHGNQIIYDFLHTAQML